MKLNSKESAEHYKALVDSQAIHAECSNRMAKLESEMNDNYIAAVDERRKEYTNLQEGLSKSEQSIRDIATMHPEWFEDTKTITTPYGTVQSRRSTKLEIQNAEVTSALLDQMGPESEVFFRRTRELDLEALERLPDDELARIRVTRRSAESIIIKPAKPNLGKAVKSAAKRSTAPEN